LAVHLKRSQILSITSLIQVLLLSPWPCWFMLDNKTCKEFKQEMNKSYKNHEQKLENELRKTSKQDSKTFWKILNRFGKKGTDKNIKNYYWPVILYFAVWSILRFWRHDLLNQGLSDLLQGEFLVGKTRLAVHLKRSLCQYSD
jgi:hypothetical protein